MSTNKYQKPWAEIIEFENDDIITASNGCENWVHQHAATCVGSNQAACTELTHYGDSNGDKRAVYEGEWI